MISRRLIAAAALLCAIASPVYAQKTKTQIITEIPLLCPVNQLSGLCTVSNANQLWSDTVNSIMPTAPVVDGNLACFNGTTGLLKDCALAPSTLIVGTTVIQGGTTSNVLFDNAGKLGEYATVPIANGGTGQATQQAGFNALAPSPTRAGDLLYWNGSNYVSFPGNNSGTQALFENASGVLSWSTVSGSGTVTNFTCFGTAITSTGTCVTAATKTDQQAATSNVLAVTPLHQQDHPSANKAIAHITYSGATPTLVAAASYNIASVSAVSTGIININFTTAFASGSYSCIAGAQAASNNQQGNSPVYTSASQLQIQHYEGNSVANPLTLDVHCTGAQ